MTPRLNSSGGRSILGSSKCTAGVELDSEGWGSTPKTWRRYCTAGSNHTAAARSTSTRVCTVRLRRNASCLHPGSSSAEISPEHIEVAKRRQSLLEGSYLGKTTARSPLEASSLSAMPADMLSCQHRERPSMNLAAS
eukprot:3167687-Rhodomonas_salina.4